METDHPHDLEEQILFRKSVCLSECLPSEKTLEKKIFYYFHPMLIKSLQSSIIISVAEWETNTSTWTHSAMEYKHNNVKKIHLISVYSLCSAYSPTELLSKTEKLEKPDEK